MKTLMRTSFVAAVVIGLIATACGSDSDNGGTNSGGTGGSKGGTSGKGGSDASTGGSTTGGTGGSTTGGAGGSTGGTAGAGATGGTATGGGAGMGGTGATDAGLTDAVCATKTAPQCRQCCGDVHPDGQQAYDAVYTNCVCQAATCKSNCSQSVCANPPNPGPTPSCNTCLDQATAAGAACAPATVQAACTDPNCAGYITCTSGCPG